MAMKTHAIALAGLAFGVTVPAIAQPESPTCSIELIVLGVGQDGGAPQLGNSADPAWTDPSLRRLATSIALVDHQLDERYLFEATPDIREQLYRLDQIAPTGRRPGLDGIFLTHGHMGHYTGLMFLGHESMGAQGVPVFAMPRMADYLTSNGPWSQLVRYENIALQPMHDGVAVEVGRLSVTPIAVPHRRTSSTNERLGGSRAACRMSMPTRPKKFEPRAGEVPKRWTGEGTINHAARNVVTGTDTTRGKAVALWFSASLADWHSRHTTHHAAISTGRLRNACLFE